uniref:Uncharacterized protein n=1 Tax=Anguilla anguilla TaxID=7936 RepID=A0A0E9TPL5_ANGAN
MTDENRQENVTTWPDNYTINRVVIKPKT